VSRKVRRAFLAVACCCVGLFASGMAVAAPQDDGFIAGYVAAILEREFGLAGADVTVEDGVVTVEAASLAGFSRDRIQAALATVPGVRAVTVVRTGAAEEPPAVTEVSPAADGASEAEEVPPGAPPETVTAKPDGVQILPRATLFESIHADPRWPHFSAAYQHFDDDLDARHVGAVSFGETLSLIRGEGFGGDWEIDFQAGVFSIFDLNSESEDLINADYVVGIPFVYREDDFSALFRVYHQSSHLGDEFLLRDDVDPEDRINLSYEAANLLLSYDFGERWRVYGGGGYLFHREPDSLDPGMAQLGVEYESDTRYWGLLWPVAALDVQFWEENGWDPDFSLRAGFRLGEPGILGEELELTAEYYNGRNPNGQFFDRDLEYFGIGLHLYFN